MVESRVDFLALVLASTRATRSDERAGLLLGAGFATSFATTRALPSQASDERARALLNKPFIPS